jgi:fumarylacetoacetate (FAA) hydrolase
MKLASLKNQTRDGCLVVVSRDLSRCVRVSDIAETMQQAIETWPKAEPALKQVYTKLNAGKVNGEEAFDPSRAASPFPRAYQFLDGSVYLSHMAKARKARGAAMPPNYETDPLMYQGLSDSFIGPRDQMVFPSEDLGIDFEAEIAVVVDDVPMGITPEQAKKHIKLIMLLNDYTLRTLTKHELPKGFGFLQAKPTSSFSPVAVSVDELPQWDGSKLNMRLTSYVNEKKVGEPHAGTDMYFNYAQLVAHAARTRNLSAGTIIGAGTVANKDHTSGSSCIAELRANEELQFAAPRTSFLKFGDIVRVEILDDAGHSVFGRISNQIAGPN